MSKVKPKLAILYGGPSSEREVSFGTRDFFVSMYKNYQTLQVEWGLDGFFYLGGKKYNEGEFLDYLKIEELAVIIASHGEFVEDGYIQEKFESRSIPFSGSNTASCKLSMDKRRSQEVVKKVVTVIPTYTNYTKLSYPFIAKPNNLGSSIGVYIISDEKVLESCVDTISQENYIFQPYITGTEISIGSVRENKGFMKLYPTEIVPKGTFFDYKSKYQTGESNEYTPARITSKLTEEIITINNSVHNLLGLGYYSRSDYILGNNGTIYYLETNALPGMTATSLVPQQLRYSQKTDSFCDGLINNLLCN